jgi:hypothetical protein
MIVLGFAVVDELKRNLHQPVRSALRIGHHKNILRPWLEVAKRIVTFEALLLTLLEEAHDLLGASKLLEHPHTGTRHTFHIQPCRQLNCERRRLVLEDLDWLHLTPIYSIRRTSSKTAMRKQRNRPITSPKSIITGQFFESHLIKR